jgi:hypothetical protein
MVYSDLPNINFPWTYNELIDMPLFSIEVIYKKLDERIEREKQKMKRRGM